MEDLKILNANINLHGAELSIVLAAGHGKRIKSNTSKMLHEIWGKPTVIRVADAARQGLQRDAQIVVVGIKAKEVATAVGKSENRLFAYQAEQFGTGHAVQVALQSLPESLDVEEVYIFPGDMGLMSATEIAAFKEAFNKSGCDMMVLTGLFQGETEENYYGRIIRVPEKDIAGVPAKEDEGKVIEIKEHKDIQSLSAKSAYRVKYKNRTYEFSKQELRENREFNSGVFAFKAGMLKTHIQKLNTDNVQGELYLTDLISIFNQNGLSVNAVKAQQGDSVLGFNTKSVLQEMNGIARDAVYQRLKNLITIEDKNDFFIADEVAEQVISLDREQSPVDVIIGKGASLGAGLIINRGLQVAAGASVRGRVQVGENCTIDTGVCIQGSDERPTILGDHVYVGGRSSITGCKIEPGVIIEHCIIEDKFVQRQVDAAGKTKPVRFALPPSDGTDAIKPLK